MLTLPADCICVSSYSTIWVFIKFLDTSFLTLYRPCITLILSGINLEERERLESVGARESEDLFWVLLLESTSNDCNLKKFFFFFFSVLDFYIIGVMVCVCQSMHKPCLFFSWNSLFGSLFLCGLEVRFDGSLSRRIWCEVFNKRIISLTLGPWIPYLLKEYKRAYLEIIHLGNV